MNEIRGDRTSQSRESCVHPHPSSVWILPVGYSNFLGITVKEFCGMCVILEQKFDQDYNIIGSIYFTALLNKNIL